VGAEDTGVKPRLRSPEEMEEVFRQIRAWGPEGERIVEVHKKLIAMLDAMIERSGHRRVGAGRQ
jgi:hypothetical protein